MTLTEQQHLIFLELENKQLKIKLSGICKVYTILRPVLKFAKVFSFIKKGGKAAIDAAILLLDEICEVPQS